MMYENNFYRTSDGALDIEFLFVDLGPNDGWRAYILTDINYKRCSGNRSDSCTDIHRLTESNETRIQKIRRFIQNTRDNSPANSPIHYICWTEKINDLDKLRNIAKAWSEITAYYIRNGGNFETIQKTLVTRGII